MKSDQLFGLIDSLFDKPELRLAVSLVGLFGLRPTELKVMRVVDGKLIVGNVKRNRATAKTPKPDRIAYPLELPELAGSTGQALVQLESGLVKLPTGIINAPVFKTCGHTFRQYLDRHSYWQPWSKPTRGSRRTASDTATPIAEQWLESLSDSSLHQWDMTCAPI